MLRNIRGTKPSWREKICVIISGSSWLSSLLWYSHWKISKLNTGKRKILQKYMVVVCFCQLKNSSRYKQDLFLLMSNRQSPRQYLKCIVFIVFYQEGTICTKTGLVRWSKDWLSGLKRNMSFVSWIFFFNLPGLLWKWSMLCVWQVLSFGPGTVYLIRYNDK